MNTVPVPRPVPEAGDRTVCSRCQGSGLVQACRPCGARRNVVGVLAHVWHLSHPKGIDADLHEVECPRCEGSGWLPECPECGEFSASGTKHPSCLLDEPRVPLVDEAASCCVPCDTGAHEGCRRKRCDCSCRWSPAAHRVRP